MSEDLMTGKPVRPAPHSPVRPPSSRGLLAVACAGVVLIVGMVAAVNLAVPLLAGSGLRPSPSALVWIVDAYVIVFACLVIPGGAAGDRFGRKGVLIAGLVTFALGALVSAVAPDVAILLTGRAVTGIGAAAVLPNTLAVLLHAVPNERKGPTIAIWASMTGIGGVIGNLGGGAVLMTGSWRWLFGALIPLALGLAALVAEVVPVSGRHDRRLDPAGAGLLVAASVALLLGIIQGPQSGWASTRVILEFVCAATLFASWTVVELRVVHPLLDPRLFRIPALRGACIGLAAIFFGMFALFYVNASFLQYAKGFSVIRTGLGILPLTVPILVGGGQVGRLTRRIGLDATVALAFAFVGCGLLGLSLSGARTPYPSYAAWLVVTGIGITLSLPPLSAAIAGSLPVEQAGVGAGLQSLTREFGSAVGVAVIGSILAARSGPTVVAFVAAADLGLRVVGVVVLVLGALVLLHALVSRQRAANR